MRAFLDLTLRPHLFAQKAARVVVFKVSRKKQQTIKETERYSKGKDTRYCHAVREGEANVLYV
jgi:hypothetical protein